MASTLRIRGGTGADWHGEHFALIAIWLDPAADGEPDALYRSVRGFADADEAMVYYLAHVQQRLLTLMRAHQPDLDQLRELLLDFSPIPPAGLCLLNSQR